ncbi:MAG: AIPR family protein, partial [Bacteroidetes bacterium]|nr:AIPR family protein [Bacteroidota bacterium]
VSYDEKLSKRGVEHKVNGYSLYENYETLDLFVTLYFQDDEIQTVTKTDAERAIDKLGKFFRNAIYKDYKNEIEESSQIFDLSHTLAEVPEVKEFLARVNIFLITNGTVKSDIKFSETIAGYSVYYRVIDVNYIFNISAQSSVPIEINFTDEGVQVPCIVNENENDDYQSYLAIIPGDALANIYEQYGSRLLEQNVRSFLQFTGKYNKGIRNTIINEPHMFLAFNNGIAATAEEVELIELGQNKGVGISVVKDFQIVNGGQTTASIYHTWKKNKDVNLSKIFVQLKLTIIKNREKFSEIVGRIAEYANTQNKVSASDLSSNRENHVILEKLSRSIWAPPAKDKVQQTQWFFERARGQYKNLRLREGYTLSRRKGFDLKYPKKQVFTKESLAKYINTFKEVYKSNKLIIAPHVVVRGAQKNYAQFLANNYGEKPDNIFFEDTVAKAILFKISEKVYGVKPNALGDMRYITVPYSIGWLGYKLNYKIDLYKIWRNQDLSETLKQVLREIMIKIEQFIMKNAPGLLYGEWAKKEDCWNRVKDQGFGISLEKLSDDLEGRDSAKRPSISDEDLEDKLVQSELTLIKSIPVNKWNEISKLGSYVEDITQHMKDRAINIMSTLKLKKELSVKQRRDAIAMIDIIVRNSPGFFDQAEINNESKESQTNEPASVKINQKFLVKMVEWDTKAKILSPSELQYLADFAYNLKKNNYFHEKNIARHLNRLIDAGFEL